MTLSELRGRSPRHAKNSKFYSDKKDANLSYVMFAQKELEKIEKSEKLILLNNIQEDIKKGIYNNFPVVAKELKSISEVIYSDIYNVNSDRKLSQNDIFGLYNYGYLE